MTRDGFIEPAFHVLSFQEEQGCSGARRYRKRKTHQKSRAGCLACKAKRVKCDELKPRCSRCQRNNSGCCYSSDAHRPHQAFSDLARDSANLQHHTEIFLGRRMRVTANLYTSSPCVTGLEPSQELTSRGTPPALLIHHFQNSFPKLLLLGKTQASSMVALGLARPFLRDALLAVSACHLNHHCTTPDMRQQARVARHSHQANAVQGFRNALAQLPLDQQTADAFVLTSMMLNLLIFTLDESDVTGNNPENSWLFRPDDPHRLSWFSLQLGLKPLLAATEAFRADSILAWMYSHHDTATSGDAGLPAGLPTHWIIGLGLEGSDGDDSSILRDPARILAETADTEPRDKAFFHYVKFVGALDSKFRFRAMLEAGDERAVWMLGLWLGLMCRFGWCWWMRARVNREWRAVCLWLNRRGVRNRPGANGHAWRLLMRELEEANIWPRPPGLERGGHSVLFHNGLS